jgi:hypothetical protein
MGRNKLASSDKRIKTFVKYFHYYHRFLIVVKKETKGLNTRHFDAQYCDKKILR